MFNSNNKEKTNTYRSLKRFITGNGVVHVKASEYLKSKKVVKALKSLDELVLES